LTTAVNRHHKKERKDAKRGATGISTTVLPVVPVNPMQIASKLPKNHAGSRGEPERLLSRLLA
jgi:hypothetical protein